MDVPWAPASKWLDFGPEVVRLGTTSRSAGAHLSHIELSDSGNGPVHSVRGWLDETFVDARVERLRFHVANLPRFHGASIRRGSTLLTGRQSWTFDGWRVTLDPVRDIDQRFKAMGVDGGYAITHVGELASTNKAPFMASEGRDVLEMLQYFLSFIRGAWTSPILVDDGDGQWAWWNIGRVDPWEGCFSSIPLYPASGGSVFPPRLQGPLESFARWWSEPDSNQIIRWLVSWYVASMTERFTDTKLVLALAGLEIVAAVYAKNPANARLRKELTEPYERLEHYFESCGIYGWSSDPELVDAYLAAESGLKSRTQTLFAIRNAVIHAKTGARPQPELRYEAALLAVEYLELSLLHKLCYDGPYFNRRVGGAQCQLPWSRKGAE